ncbi:Restriction endonuclease S subunit [Moritella viscosa]|uniref:restriction endonuclease subunit S n=1 Tax=Moritella viscosa TaxID=80854 RepID=UPI00091D5396|nr:restriction endonuclease subunit S [Moritella viscosa]SGZ09856.1 Restriction endonuclease S subunit [Moritella viscosa]
MSTKAGCWVTDVAYSVIPPRGIDLQFAFLQFHTFGLDVLGKGIKPGLNRNDAYGLSIALPPFNEQRRIVAKVDELMLLCDQLEQETESSIDAHKTLVETLLTTLTNSTDSTSMAENWARISEHFDTLFTTEHSIDQLKQTVLQLAVMGKLVPQDPTDEPASVLLERIAAEKAQLVKDKKIKKQKTLPPITDEEKPFGLPDGWEWCRIFDVAELITSGSRDWAKYYSDTGAIFVTMGNLSRGHYNLRMDNIRYVSPPESGEGSRTKLVEHDLLISITGDVGNLGLIPEDFGDAYINQHTCLLRLMPELHNRYIPEVIRSPLAKYQFDAPQRGIKNSFRLSDVGEVLIPIPPINEHTRIVSKIDGLMLLCDQLKTQIKQAHRTQLSLADTIVKQTI